MKGFSSAGGGQRLGYVPGVCWELYRLGWTLEVECQILSEFHQVVIQKNILQLSTEYKGKMITHTQAKTQGHCICSIFVTTEKASIFFIFPTSHS